MVSATHPPIEWPATRTEPSSRWSRSPKASPTRSAIEYGAGGDDEGAIPRLSKVITWYSARTSSGPTPTCHAIAGCPHPHTSRIGSPSPNTSYAIVTSSSSTSGISISWWVVASPRDSHTRSAHGAERSTEPRGAGRLIASDDDGDRDDRGGGQTPLSGCLS